MTDERPEDRTADRHGERDSQLSAMFDGELPAAECELLARRLTRDESLRAQWSRYSMIGAALRAERGVALHDRVALRVQSAVAKEATYGEAGAMDAARPAQAASPLRAKTSRWQQIATPLVGASIAASVAAVSIFWLRDSAEPQFAALQASTAAPTSIVLTADPSPLPQAGKAPVDNDAGLYSTPAPSSATSIAPPARLANYVVAHSEYSGPLTRRMALLGIVGAESGEAAEAAPATDGAQRTEAVDAP